MYIKRPIKLTKDSRTSCLVSLEGGLVHSRRARRPRIETQPSSSVVALRCSSSVIVSAVHFLLQEALPHLFNQMFCRLHLLRVLRELYHSALDTLNLPPIRQL